MIIIDILDKILSKDHFHAQIIIGILTVLTYAKIHDIVVDYYIIFFGHGLAIIANIIAIGFGLTTSLIVLMICSKLYLKIKGKNEYNKN